MQALRREIRKESMTTPEPTISENQLKVLQVLGEHFSADANCLYIRTIAKEAKLEQRIARIAVRALARKGLAQYVRGLFDDDGMVAGSGYCATREGAMVVNGCKNKATCGNMADMITGECQPCWDARRVFKFTRDWGDYKAGDTVTREKIGNGVIFKDLYFGTEKKHYQDKAIVDVTPDQP